MTRRYIALKQRAARIGMKIGVPYTARCKGHMTACYRKSEFGDFVVLLQQETIQPPDVILRQTAQYARRIYVTALRTVSYVDVKVFV